MDTNEITARCGRIEALLERLSGELPAAGRAELAYKLEREQGRLRDSLPAFKNSLISLSDQYALAHSLAHAALPAIIEGTEEETTAEPIGAPPAAMDEVVEDRDLSERELRIVEALRTYGGKYTKAGIPYRNLLAEHAGLEKIEPDELERLWPLCQ